MESVEIPSVSDNPLPDANVPTVQASFSFKCPTHGVFYFNRDALGSKRFNKEVLGPKLESDRPIPEPKIVRVSEVVELLQERVATLNKSLAEAKDAVQRWVERREELFSEAALDRAENQGRGRGPEPTVGFFDVLLGRAESKIRAAKAHRAGERKLAGDSNAEIAKNVAEERARIADGKREAQAVVAKLQQQLVVAKGELKSAKARAKRSADDEATVADQADASVDRANASIDQANASLDLLKKLKEAKDAGLLSEAEFEEKRRKLLSMI